MTGIGRKIGVGLIGGSLMLSSTAVAAANTPSGAQANSQWVTLTALGTASSAAAVSSAQENPQWADPYADHSGHGLSASVALLGLGILLVIAVIALSHDTDNDESPISPF